MLTARTGVRRVIQTPNNANNGIKFHGGRLLATYEAGMATQRIAHRPSLIANRLSRAHVVHRYRLTAALFTQVPHMSWS